MVRGNELEFYRIEPLVLGMFAWVVGGNLISRSVAKRLGVSRPGWVRTPLKKWTLRELLMLAACALAFFGGFIATVLLTAQ